MDIVPTPSTSSGRQLRQRKKPRYDPDDGSEDEQLQLVKQVSRRQSKSASNKKPRKGGKLASFVNLPLDILLEIFSHLHPYDLLKLSRTTKDFRRILIQRSSISTWRSSFADVEDLPECPPGMTEPAWANLAFSPHCHVCLAPGVRNVEWRFRIRMCSKCAPTQLIEIYPAASIEETYRFVEKGFGAPAQNLPDIRYLLPNREGKKHKRVFMLRDLIGFRDKYKALESPEERLAFIDDQRKAVEALNLHATNCAAWFHNQADDRSEELQKLRQERKQAIMKKLEQLGYKKDLDSIRYPDSLDRQAFVNKPQRLTDRIWNNIKPAAIMFMDQMRQKRLQREHAALIVTRKVDAGRFLRLAKNRMLPCNEAWPEALDFCALPEVAAIVQQPLGVEIDAETFERLLGPVQSLFTSWREQIIIPHLQHFILGEIVRDSIKNTGMVPTGSKEILQYLRHDSIGHQALLHSLARRRIDPTTALTMQQINTKMCLAATVYVCKRCSDTCCIRLPGEYHLGGYDDWTADDAYVDCRDDDSDDDDDGLPPRSVKPIRPMFYPQVLGHPCLTRSEVDNPVHYFKAFGLIGSSFMANTVFNPTTWSVTNLALDTKASEMAALIVQIAGLDPTTTTAEDMDGRDLRFYCNDCMPLLRRSKDEEIPTVVGELRPFYTWRGAVMHQATHHIPRCNPSSVPASCRRSSPSVANLFIVSPSDPLMAQIRREEKRIENEDAAIWGCAICPDSHKEKDLWCLPELKEHLHFSHQITQRRPVLNEDYFKHYAAPDLKNEPRCVAWIDTATGSV